VAPFASRLAPTWGTHSKVGASLLAKTAAKFGTYICVAIPSTFIAA